MVEFRVRAQHVPEGRWRLPRNRVDPGSGNPVLGRLSFQTVPQGVLREALLHISGYAGFSAAHEALDVLSEDHRRAGV